MDENAGKLFACMAALTDPFRDIGLKLAAWRDIYSLCLQTFMCVPMLA